MDIDFALVKEVGVFSPRGILDYASTLKLMEVVTAKFSPQVRGIVINLKEVEYLNSAAFSILEILFSEAKKSGFRIALCGVTGLTKEILKQFPTQGFELYCETQDEAVTKINQSN